MKHTSYSRTHTMTRKFAVAAFCGAAFPLGACTDDLDVKPIDPLVVTEASPEALVNKIYAQLALDTNDGSESAVTDIADIDSGTSGFLRQLWNSNQLTTDEAICAWSDAGIDTYNTQQYNASHPMLQGLYYRLYFAVAQCNHYLDNYAQHNATLTAEVRTLRALFYYCLLDGWRNVPLDLHSNNKPAAQTKPKDLYDFIESELTQAMPNLMESRVCADTDPDYCRLKKGAAQMLLARLYLNAEVYTGTPQWQKAYETASQIIAGPYSLSGEPATDPDGNTWSAYQKLFMGDNGSNGAQTEAILPIYFDGKTTCTYGAVTFMRASVWSSDMYIFPGKPTNGTKEAWMGNRARAQLTNKWFAEDPGPHGASEMARLVGDDRCLLFSAGDGRSLNASKMEDFMTGFSVAKFCNFYTDGQTPKSPTFADADFFLFRLAEAYMTRAEAAWRLGKTDEALADINTLRTRANAAPLATIAPDGREIIDEWSREFYFECRRRTDLVRWGLYTGGAYLWEWKGGEPQGKATDSHLNIFAIPVNDIVANRNLRQNDGYGE